MRSIDLAYVDRLIFKVNRAMTDSRFEYYNFESVNLYLKIVVNFVFRTVVNSVCTGQTDFSPKTTKIYECRKWICTHMFEK